MGGEYIVFVSSPVQPYPEYLTFKRVAAESNKVGTSETKLLNKHRNSMASSFVYIRSDSDKNWIRLLIRNRVEALVRDVVESGAENVTMILNKSYGQVLLSAAHACGISMNSLNYTFTEWENTYKLFLKDKSKG